MNNTKINKVLVIGLVVMFLLNIATLTALWSTHKKNHKNSKTKYRVARKYKKDNKSNYKHPSWVKTLELSEEQEALYMEERKLHKKRMLQIKDSIRTNKTLIHKEVSKPDPNMEYVSQLADSIGRLNAEFERTNYLHFIKVKTFLNPEQEEKFLKLIQRAPSRDNLHQKYKRDSKRSR